MSRGRGAEGPGDGWLPAETGAQVEEGLQRTTFSKKAWLQFCRSPPLPSHSRHAPGLLVMHKEKVGAGVGTTVKISLGVRSPDHGSWLQVPPTLLIPASC